VLAGGLRLSACLGTFDHDRSEGVEGVLDQLIGDSWLVVHSTS
jgi:hypothetical protein